MTALFFLLRRLRRYNAVFVSNINPIKKSVTRYSHTKIILLILNIAVMLLLVSIAAGPRGVGGIKEDKLTGIDIVIAMDISGSMRAEDFKPNRIEAAKRITIDFIEKMKGNRIGLALFAGRSFTQAPLTVDYEILKTFINRIDLGMIDISGTAIGDAVVTGVNRLFDNKARSKVVVLLTDGENNGGSIDPLTAAAVARHRDVKVYTIGIGTSEGAPIPVYSESGRVVGRILVKIDEKQLRDIAEITGGKYIRASDEKGLINAFNQIAAMEKGAIEIKRYTIYKEYYPHLAVIAVFIFSSSFFYERIKRGIRRNQIIKDIFAVSLILLLLFIAVSQKAGGKDTDGEGMDIVVAIDASLSMLAEDVSPNRAGYADSLAKRIITSLPVKRAGIVLFSDYGYI
ncbi:MAG: VWA domain-containing protein, partial [Nitrospinae bacterium]|nr:VWA domain-containing protein [Nitrospinota bacterium]